jgi:hypothetical protein
MEDIPTQVREFLRKILVFGEQNRTIQKYAPFILSISLACWMLRGLQWYLIALSMHQFSLRRWTLYSYTRCLPSSPSSRSLLPGGKSIRQVSIVIVFAAMGAYVFRQVILRFTRKFHPNPKRIPTKLDIL